MGCSFAGNYSRRESTKNGAIGTNDRVSAVLELNLGY